MSICSYSVLIDRMDRMGLPPLIQAKAAIIERGSVGIDTFMIGPEYDNKLRREVQHLPQRRFQFAEPVAESLPLDDLRRSPNNLDVARTIGQRMSSRIDVPESSRWAISSSTPTFCPKLAVCPYLSIHDIQLESENPSSLHLPSTNRAGPRLLRRSSSAHQESRGWQVLKRHYTGLACRRCINESTVGFSVLSYPKIRYVSSDQTICPSSG